jgi:hypothetical protein
MIDLALFKVPEIRRGILMSLSFSVLLWYYIYINNKYYIIYENYWNYVSLSATLLGFMITAFTIFISFPSNFKMKLLSKNENYPLLIAAFLWTIYLLIILLASSISGVFVDLPNFPYLYEIASFLFLFILNWSLVSVLITIWILKRVVDLIIKN